MRVRAVVMHGSSSRPKGSRRLWPAIPRSPSSGSRRARSRRNGEPNGRTPLLDRRAHPRQWGGCASGAYGSWLGGAPPGDDTARAAWSCRSTRGSSTSRRRLRPGRCRVYRDESLSPRETQVLRLAAKGMAGRQIARTLGVSPKTVEQHKTQAFKRLLACRTRAAAVAVLTGGMARGADPLPESVPPALVGHWRFLSWAGWLHRSRRVRRQPRRVRRRRAAATGDDRGVDRACRSVSSEPVHEPGHARAVREIAGRSPSSPATTTAMQGGRRRAPRWRP